MGKKKIDSRIVAFCLIALCSANCILFAQNAEPYTTSENALLPASTDFDYISKLLSAYLENDLTLQDLALQRQKAELAKQSAEISNGFDITLSTGTMSVRTSNGATTFSVRPSVETVFPQFKNLSLKVGVNLSASNKGYSNEDSSTDGTSDGNSASTTSRNTIDFSDSAISLGIDIISANELNRKITLMKTERTLTEAEWRLTNAALTSEKSFYSELKSIFSIAQSILSERATLYTDEISFAEAKARGYSEKSSTYRLAEMKVLSDKHTVETKTREFNHALTVFYAKCGSVSDDLKINFEISDTIEQFLAVFSSKIPKVEPIIIDDFEKEKFSELEAARWTHNINSLSRSAKKNFSLSANAGYTLGNSLFSDTSSNSTSKRPDTADIGLSSTIGSVKLTGGVNIPVTGNSHVPSFTASATFTPNTEKQNKITKQTDALSEEQELIAIEEAKNKYETTLVDKKQSLRDIEWQMETNESALQMHREIEADLKAYYENGFIKESEYLSAKNNVESYTIKKTLNDIDLIIYNNEIRLLFR